MQTKAALFLYSHSHKRKHNSLHPSLLSPLSHTPRTHQHTHLPCLPVSLLYFSSRLLSLSPLFTLALSLPPSPLSPLSSLSSVSPSLPASFSPEFLLHPLLPLPPLLPFASPSPLYALAPLSFPLSPPSSSRPTLFPSTSPFPLSSLKHPSLHLSITYLP